jgi:type II secretory pathway component GspD/PulD (secretin)
LEQHGDTELVILDLPLNALSAEQIAKELTPAPNRSIMGPLESVVSIPSANQLMLRDTVQNLKNLVAILRNADQAEKKKGEIYQHQCLSIKAEEAEKILKDVLGVPPQNQSANGEPNAVHVSSDNVSNIVFVAGPPAKIRVAKETVETLEKANQGQRPVVKTYKIPGGNTKNVAKAIKEFYFSHDVQVSPVGKDSILVFATPVDQDTIRRYIEGASDQTRFYAIQLYTLDAKKAYDNLTSLLDLKHLPGPTLDYNASTNLILVKGTPEQIRQVTDTLEKLGEKTLAEGKAARTGLLPHLPLLEGSMPGTPSAGPAEKQRRLKLLEEKLDKLYRDVETLRQELRSEFQREGRGP